MNIEVWISFFLASIVLCFTPGPTVFIVMDQFLCHGKKSVIPFITGVLCGDVIAMSISFAGLGVLLSTSATLFNIFKWLAAAYLIFLGIKAWNSRPIEEKTLVVSNENKKIFKDALVVTALNPKGVIFFIAFFPLFLDANNSVLVQMLVVALTFLLVSALSASFYSFFSGYIRSKVKTKKFQKTFSKISGFLLMGAGTVTATLQK